MTAHVEQVELAPGGPRVSRVVAGCWRLADWGLDVAGRVRYVEECLDLGLTTFDHADIYGDYRVEELFGEALAARPGLRDRMQIVTKCGIELVSPGRPENTVHAYDTSAAHVVASVEQSLRALRTDHVDVLLIHRPDWLMEPGELAAALATLRAQGKVLHLGVSNHSPSKLALLHRLLPLVTNQVELSVLHLDALDDGTLDQCLELGLRPMAWSPLGGGRLFDAPDERAARVLEVLRAIGEARGVSAVTIAYAWILRHPSGPLPIVGSGKLDRLCEAVAALDLTLERDEWYRVWEASAGHEVP